MALTSALYTALSGLDVNSRTLDVVGNNIANVNTHAFKSTRANFTSQLTQNLSYGTPPTGDTGGTNPSQVGLGARFVGTQRNFDNGAIQSTGINSDLALEGAGFFIVRQGSASYYTRTGAFDLNAENKMVTPTGAVVQGYGVDSNFNIVKGALEDVVIPVGTLTIAEATNNVNFAGNLNASGVVATTGSVHSSRAFYTDAALTTLADGASEDLTAVGNDLYISDGAGGSFLAIEGGSDTIMSVTGVEKGGKDLGEFKFAFADAAVVPTLGVEVDGYGSTLEDFADFLKTVFGLDNQSINGHDLGGDIAIVNGEFVVTGNEGTTQDLRIETTNFHADPQNPIVGGINTPFVFTKDNSADGESVRTSFVVHDSLGTPLTVDLSFVLQETIPGSGTIWEFVVESAENDDTSRVLGLGVVEFDTNGQFVSASNSAFSMIRANGAETPLTINMNFTSGADTLSALTDISSRLAAVFQDGSPIGTLDAFSVGENGMIVGAFTNGLTRNIGQITLATFSNPEGLVDAGNGVFRPGPNSGAAVEVTPQSFGAARIISGALELSNVDLSQEFVKLITATTGFSASSRVITTSDQLIQQLLTLSR